MADWRDVMDARREADDALADNDCYGANVAERDHDTAPLAVPLAARAIALELRALGTTIDYAMGAHTQAVAPL